MGLGYAKSAAESLVDGLYERMLGVGHDLVARDELPGNAEELAETVVHVVLDVLAAGVRQVNQDTGLRPDDPRRHAAEQADGDR